MYFIELTSLLGAYVDPLKSKLSNEIVNIYKNVNTDASHSYVFTMLQYVNFLSISATQIGTSFGCSSQDS